MLLKERNANVHLIIFKFAGQEKGRMIGCRRPRCPSSSALVAREAVVLKRCGKRVAHVGSEASQGVIVKGVLVVRG